MRHVSRRRNPSARYTREIVQANRTEKRTGREQGPRGSRILPATRHPRALRQEIINASRDKWRKFDWAMHRVCKYY